MFIEINFPSNTFSTKEYLSDAELYLYAYRVYDPIAGRWIQRDPIDYQDSINLYQFCGNNPVNKTDVDGRLSETMADPDLVKELSPEAQQIINESKADAIKVIKGWFKMAFNILKAAATGGSSALADTVDASAEAAFGKDGKRKIDAPKTAYEITRKGVFKGSGIVGKGYDAVAEIASDKALQPAKPKPEPKPKPRPQLVSGK